jgi:hypothetical protein
MQKLRIYKLAIAICLLWAGSLYGGIPKPARGEQINKSRLLARGLVGCWMMNEGTGDKVFDLTGSIRYSNKPGRDRGLC